VERHKFKTREEKNDMKFRIEPPFFEIGPKAYLYGQDALDMAKAAEEASIKYGV